MRRLMWSTIAMVAAVIGGLVVWHGLNEQARGMVVGIGIGILVFAAGIILALAIVGVFLLVNLRWSVQSKPGAPPVVVHGAPSWPALSAPAGPAFSAPVFRQPRQWIVGGDDVEEAQIEDGEAMW